MYVRNAVTAGYTFVEAIGAWQGIADHFVVFDGTSDDGTWDVLVQLQQRLPELELVRERPAYLDGPTSVTGEQLGAAFEHARRRLDTTWQVMVQADCVFHRETAAALRLATRRPADGVAAFTVVRHQYRWNWQEMYLESELNLCTHRDRAEVMGDAMSCAVDGYADARLLPLFRRLPVTDSAWCFWSTLSGKIASCAEIWTTQSENAERGEFAWYDANTGRDFVADAAAFEATGAVPPGFESTTTPFADRLPASVVPWVGSRAYDTRRALQQLDELRVEDLRPQIDALAEVASSQPDLVRTSPTWRSKSRSAAGRAARLAGLR